MFIGKDLFGQDTESPSALPADRQRDFDLFKNKYAVFLMPDNTPKDPGTGKEEQPCRQTPGTNNIYAQTFSLDGQYTKLRI
jgi:hypothetical protein